MRMRAIKGATTVTEDGARQICDATAELLAEMLSRNALTPRDAVSLFLTVTPDLRSEFPARGARESGWGAVPTLCAVEIDVPGALPRCIRALTHVEVPAGHVIAHVYLHDARDLRPDLTRDPR